MVKYKQQFKEHTTQVECVRNIHRDGWVGKEKRRFKITHEGTFVFCVKNTAELFVVGFKSKFEGISAAQ